MAVRYEDFRLPNGAALLSRHDCPWPPLARYREATFRLADGRVLVGSEAIEAQRAVASTARTFERLMMQIADADPPDRELLQAAVASVDRLVARIEGANAE